MNDISQNFARKLRPTHFDEIVGQPFTVRMLKNSLYLRSLFPVYLFAGQRGCGKTTTARVLAAAVNCAHYEEFATHPTRYTVPCRACDSCSAMREGRHLDFIEIDAASHTGVDHVRSLLEGAVHVPLMGRFKIYLIDEVHMLSKAAFNALLKMLEEPPASVLFLLATTEREKIPETVRSRAFQLFFDPLPAADLTKYLRTVADTERISIDDAALGVLVQQSEGSVRDALNALERMKFLEGMITADRVYESLGYISPAGVVVIFEKIAEQNVAGLLATLQDIGFSRYDPVICWKLLVELVRSLVWMTYVGVTASGPFEPYRDQLAVLAHACSADRLRGMLQILWAQEAVLLKSTHAAACLEYVLFLLCQQIGIDELEQRVAALRVGLEGTDAQIAAPAPLSKPTQAHLKTAKRSEMAAAQPVLSSSTPAVPPEMVHESIASSATLTQTIRSEPGIRSSDPRWEQFGARIRESVASDQLLCSIVQQAHFVSYDERTHTVMLQWRGNGKFFEEALRDRHEVLAPASRDIFGSECVFVAGQALPREHNVVSENHARDVSEMASGVPEQRVLRQAGSAQSLSPHMGASAKPGAAQFDEEQWPTASLVQRVFPGTLEITE